MIDEIAKGEGPDHGPPRMLSDQNFFAPLNIATRLIRREYNEPIDRRFLSEAEEILA